MILYGWNKGVERLGDVLEQKSSSASFIYYGSGAIHWLRDKKFNNECLLMIPDRSAATTHVGVRFIQLSVHRTSLGAWIVVKHTTF